MITFELLIEKEVSSNHLYLAENIRRPDIQLKLKSSSFKSRNRPSYLTENPIQLISANRIIEDSAHDERNVMLMNEELMHQQDQTSEESPRLIEGKNSYQINSSFNENEPRDALEGDEDDEEEEEEEEEEENLFSPVKSSDSSSSDETEKISDSNPYLTTTATASTTSYDLWVDTHNAHKSKEYGGDADCMLKSVTNSSDGASGAHMFLNEHQGRYKEIEPELQVHSSHSGSATGQTTSKCKLKFQVVIVFTSHSFNRL